ncbi:hypothetical protein O6H91_11G093700 [Diphasiastrum complanatum]|uniref:Uncharacterized protein n=1 Tax=Diphasiastrum complanatum TaxID=34168 RepID=A0ACC2CBX6_DIPCM|nr:hypothetical protein O6H91_Y232300 [Diphasiastrum complanatum]KAJ7294790.1 hypothetical protein O6H91_Y232300 [Diphasiastrum complanatum]KAJ7539452.1 hypothetical protein O6H91_11G093700 [Diphasiastrum complanatum]
MLKNPVILLLDEATSALDAESEHVVQDALNKIMLGRTTIIVAHRLSTVRNADYIPVLQQGKVVELGRHDDLIMKQDGAYALLVRLQEKATVQADTESQCVSGGGSPKRRSHNHECGGSDEGQKHIETRQLSLSKQRHSSYDKPSMAPDGSIKKAVRANIKIKTTKSYTWRLMKINAPEWPYGLMGTIGAILAGLINPIYAILMGQILHVYYDPDHGRMQREIQKSALIFSGVGVLGSLFLFTMHYFFGIIGENLTKRVREMMLAAMLRNEVGWFDREENNSSEMASRLASSAASVRVAVGDRICIIVQNVSLVVTACAVAFTINWRLTIVFLLVFPLLVGSAIVQNLFLKGFAGDIAKAHDRATMLAGEAISNIRTIAAFNAQEKVVQLVSQALIGPKHSITRRGHAAGLGYGLAALLMFWSYGLTLWYGAVLVRDGKATYGDITKCFFVVLLTASAVSSTVSFTPDMVKSGQALKSVFEILDRESENNTEHDQGEHVNAVKGDVKLKNVEFHYPSRPKVHIFRSLTISVNSGQSLALVGASGSGKSSVIALIGRFYDPVSGHVLIDGKDIRKLNLRSLRKHIGLVQQEPAFFASTIYENILFGKDDASESEIIEAAKAANAHEFISALPDGYKTHVGERGVQLSGGQKQRVAIARAVLKNPAILLLDEATSALDSESESMVQKALDGLMQARTTIVVAHRLSTIRNANKIAVLEAGTIIEQGSHSELIGQHESAYSRLIKLQHDGTGGCF